MTDRDRVPPVRDTSDLMLNLSLNEFTQILRAAIKTTKTELARSNADDAVALGSDLLEQQKHLTLIRTQFACFEGDTKFIKNLVFIYALSGATALWMSLSTFEPKEIITLTFREEDYAKMQLVMWDGITPDITAQAIEWEKKFPLARKLAEAEQQILGTTRAQANMTGASSRKVGAPETPKEWDSKKSISSRLLEMAGRKSSDRSSKSKSQGTGTAS